MAKDARAELSHEDAALSERDFPAYDFLREPRPRRERKPALPRVLLVDEDVLERRAAARALAGLAETTAVANGEDALRRFRRGAFDVVVTRHHMSAMTGLELLEQIRVLDPKARRVLVSPVEIPGLLGHLASGLVERRASQLQELAVVLRTLRARPGSALNPSD